MGKEWAVRPCGCVGCLAGEEADQEDHRQLILILSRLNEQERRWVAGREAKRRGHGGIQQVAEITGLHPETIRRGRDELDEGLQGRPAHRVRLPGGGRPRIEKKTPRSNRISFAS